MPRKKTQSKGAKQKPVSLPVSDDPADNLRAFITEADQIDFLTKQMGWDIIVRDFNIYKTQKASEIPYLDKDSVAFQNAILEYRAIDKFFKLIDDYKINRQRAIEALEKIEHPESHITLDVDN